MMMVTLPELTWELNSILFYTFFFVSAIQFLFFALIFFKLVFYKSSTQSSEEVPVSIIIAARNERENLLRHLPVILNQNYPCYEVVVVNDRSWDYTADVFGEFQDAYNNFKYVNIPENKGAFNGKKFALTLGIKAAKYENLLFTDADCVPVSKHWISNMAKHFKNKSIILGVSPYKKEPGFLNMIIRFDTSYIAAKYLSTALAGIPYMGVGRNLAYSKEIFFESGGFKRHYNLLSGDDDLFVNENAKKSNIAIEFDKESFVESLPKRTWKEWFNQKRRHVTAASSYSGKSKLFLGLFFTTLFLFYALLGVLLGMNQSLNFVIALFLVRLVAQFIVLFKPLKHAGGLDVYLLLPILEPIWLVVSMVISVSNFVLKPSQWR